MFSKKKNLNSTLNRDLNNNCVFSPIYALDSGNRSDFAMDEDEVIIY